MPQIPSSDVISWVVGRGGLLGRSVESMLAARGAIWHPHRRFSWSDPLALERELTTACREFATAVGSSPWQIAWCAGASAVGSASSDLANETTAFCRLLEVTSEVLCKRMKGSGALFLASSAGGLYAGADSPPFNETSPVAPLAPYGWNKLEQEFLACTWSRDTATPLLVGRLSNIYGPGQNFSKGQGLITEVCLRVLTHRPLILYVPLDTIRDYLFNKDAGRLVADGLTRLRVEASEANTPPCVVKILASNQPATIAVILAQFRWITKRPATVIVATSPNSRRQAPDLRMASSVWPEIDRHPVATLSEGMRWVLTDILAAAREGRIGRDQFSSPLH
jgi:UDP-glucose 4-epimerase